MASRKPPIVIAAFEDLTFGGTDTRSNPLNMPTKRMLRCLNWRPMANGLLQLRDGYATVTIQSIVASEITALIPYKLWTGTQYIIRFQGTTPYQITVSSGAVTNPTVRGTAFSSSAKGSFYAFNNRIHYGNGTDQKWFDGTTWRDNGLRALTATEVNGVSVTEGVREPASGDLAAVTLTPAGGGSFPATTLTGILFYFAYFDTSVNELGPATMAITAGRKTLTLNQKMTVAVLPTPSNANWVKLIGRSNDGATDGYFCTNTSTSVTSCTRSGTTLTVISGTHGLSTGDVVILSGTTNFDGMYKVTVSDGNTFTVTLRVATGANTTGGTCKRVVMAANATASVDVLAPTTDTSMLINEANRGIAASTIGGSTPGYQFYASIANPNGGGHVGNRIAIGNRYAPTYRTNLHIAGLPDLSGTDSEWEIQIGRTGDGALIPYASVDSNGNFLYAASAQTSVTVQNHGTTDGNNEMPFRNTVIPAACDKFAVVGDYIWAADSVSATVRRSGSATSARFGTVLGQPEQSWASDDIQTFPTNDVVTAIAEVDLETFVASANDCAILTDVAGIPMWRGPWRKGCAGKRAVVKTDHGFFWVSTDKELCTFDNGLPTAISEEYEAGELAQIDDQYVSTIECVYHRDAAKLIDEIRIVGRKSDGTAHTIIHDFRLRDGESPYGQGRGVEYLGPLAARHTLTQTRDSSGARQVWAGGTDGNIYQLYQGANDAGNEFTADGIMLINAGPNRVDVPWIDYYGDQLVNVSIGHTLNTAIADFESLSTSITGNEIVQGAEDSFLYRVHLNQPEIVKKYLRFQLTSHSADGDMTLNNPPHCPLESYGRIYEVVPGIGMARGR
ncbi:MAG: hypothetical protein EPN91_03175 [Salinibacterium sp.]|nr:MAG: hypothetical protein EPN91_03175 [Salinibacterium sp.]